LKALGQQEEEEEEEKEEEEEEEGKCGRETRGDRERLGSDKVELRHLLSSSAARGVS
jgi:hypothetical protein